MLAGVGGRWVGLCNKARQVSEGRCASRARGRCVDARLHVDGLAAPLARAPRVSKKIGTNTVAVAPWDGRAVEPPPPARASIRTADRSWPSRRPDRNGATTSGGKIRDEDVSAAGNARPSCPEGRPEFLDGPRGGGAFRIHSGGGSFLSPSFLSVVHYQYHTPDVLRARGQDLCSRILGSLWVGKAHAILPSAAGPRTCDFPFSGAFGGLLMALVPTVYWGGGGA